jgi:hypothetical protein
MKKPASAAGGSLKVTVTWYPKNFDRKPVRR